MKRKVITFCPFCECEHELDHISANSSILIKGEMISYISNYYYCKNHPEEKEGFVTGKMMDENLARARNAYRKKHDLLTSDEIIGIRKKYNLSQLELANMLGWGGATISRYESKQIQDEAHDTILKTIGENPKEALKLLEKNAESFSETRYNEIKSIITKAIEESDYLQREVLESEYINYRELSEFNGYRLLDIDTIEQVISYIASKVNNLYKTMLMKYLWYVDMNYYKNYGHSLTGLVYLHQSYGALPMGHIIDLKNVNVDVEIGYDGGEIYHILPNPDLEINLNSDAISTIDDVVIKFEGMDRKQIVEYMHKESAYLETNDNEAISYNYAKKLNH